MIKADLIRSHDTCLGKAQPDEECFLLIGRDAAAPDAIRHWCSVRVSKGLNQIDDEQITSALATADAMEQQRDQIRARQA